MILRDKHVKALRRAIYDAQVWRGSMVGNPDTSQLEKFDRYIATAKEALKVVRHVYDKQKSQK